MLDLYNETNKMQEREIQLFISESHYYLNEIILFWKLVQRKLNEPEILGFLYIHCDYITLGFAYDMCLYK